LGFAISNNKPTVKPDSGFVIPSGPVLSPDIIDSSGLTQSNNHGATERETTLPTDNPNILEYVEPKPDNAIAPGLTLFPFRIGSILQYEVKDFEQWFILIKSQLNDLPIETKRFINDIIYKTDSFLPHFHNNRK